MAGEITREFGWFTTDRGIDRQGERQSYPHPLEENSLEGLIGKELRRSAKLPAPTARVTAPLSELESGISEVNAEESDDPGRAALRVLKYCDHNGRIHSRSSLVQTVQWLFAWPP
jgi:hypothetical protein